MQDTNLLYNQRIILLHEFEEDYAWVHENHEELVQDYGDQWIGVKNRQVIAADYELEPLLNRLREQNCDPAHTVIEFVPQEQIKIIV